ncbi:MAG: hypothetical protein KGL39_22840 [Patescibacteria group bacterium]|nr:hypothetical protein [Patescibacteria group bacterium]
MSYQSDSFSRVGQDIRELESKKADKHEIYSTNSRVDSLAHSNREMCSDVNGLRAELQTAQEELRRMKEVIREHLQIDL